MERVSKSAVGLAGVIGGAAAFVALVVGCTVGSLEADKQRTQQISDCLTAGHTFVSGAPTLCVAPDHEITDMHSKIEIRGGGN